MDTRVRVYALIDYSQYYGQSKTIDDAKELIKVLPSESLINYVAGINSHLYLQENDEESQRLQMFLAKHLLHHIGHEAEQKYLDVCKKELAAGNAPIIFWNYTNLQFYNLIFENFNHLPCRELNASEMQNFFDAYLILNDVANKRVELNTEDFANAIAEGTFEKIIMANFLYQKDYASTVDYANQVTRGVLFFRYLENDPIFGPAMNEFYQERNVSGHLEMFRNLMVLFTQIGIGQPNRKQIADLSEFASNKFTTPAYLDTLCINSTIPTYSYDQSFTALRNQFLYKIFDNKYYILDANFMIDQFYKAQVFAVNNFLKKKGITKEFLSKKGKDFSDAIYFPTVMKTCFPDYINFFGDQCKNSKDKELCDGYIRDGNKLMIIEFKDVLLNASIKNAADESKLFDEFRTKFVENQKGDPKGMSQLKAAVEDVDKNGINFDSAIKLDDLTIFPIIVYTDLSFGADGLNEHYREVFNDMIAELDLKNVSVQNITFINLNFFEFNQDYFAKKITDAFVYLEKYQEHVEEDNFKFAPFEVFSRSYNNDHENLGQPESYLKVQREIIESTPKPN